MSREEEIEELISTAATSNGYKKVEDKGLKTIFKNEHSGDVVEVLSPELLNLKTAALSAQRFRSHTQGGVDDTSFGHEL